MAKYIKYKPVIGFEDSYEVSYCGKIRSLDRFIIRKNGVIQKVKGQYMTILKNKKKYLIVYFSIGKKTISKLVHRLVAESWIENPNNFQLVLHKDDNPSNTHGDNLFWGNYSMNIQDCWNKKRRNPYPKFGLKNVNGKLSNKDVIKIKSMILNKKTGIEIANLFGVTAAAISCIKTGKTHINI